MKLAVIISWLMLLLLTACQTIPSPAYQGLAKGMLRAQVMQILGEPACSTIINNGAGEDMEILDYGVHATNALISPLGFTTLRRLAMHKGVLVFKGTKTSLREFLQQGEWDWRSLDKADQRRNLELRLEQLAWPDGC